MLRIARSTWRPVTCWCALKLCCIVNSAYFNTVQHQHYLYASMLLLRVLLFNYDLYLLLILYVHYISYLINFINLHECEGLATGWRKLFSSKHLKEETYELNKSTCISISRLLAFTQIRLLIVVRNANDWYSYLPRRAACVATGTGFSKGGSCVARRYGGFYRYLGLMLAWVPVVSYYYYVLSAVIK